MRPLLGTLIANRQFLKIVGLPGFVSCVSRYSSVWRGSNRGNTQNKKSLYHQSFTDFRCYLELARFEPRRQADLAGPDAQERGDPLLPAGDRTAELGAAPRAAAELPGPRLLYLGVLRPGE